MQTILFIFRDAALRKKILFMLAMLAIFRFAAAIPTPGVDQDQLAAFFSGNQGQLFELLNIFTGGALDNLSIMMLGVGPYITASIIMQLLTMIFPQLKALYHEEGEAGKKKFMQYSRYLTVPLALLQGFGLLTLLARQGVIENLELIDWAVNLTIVTAGSVGLMWLGEIITDYGIGNGVSILIFAGIVASIPGVLGNIVFTFSVDQVPFFLGFLGAAILIIAGVVFITEGERPIPISYAKRVRGMKLYGGVSTYLPLRVNQAGVIPIIFALSLILFPQMILSVLAGSSYLTLANIANVVVGWLDNSIVYAVMYFTLVFLFTYFYTAITFDPAAISQNLQKSGGFIPGMRPGRPTAEYLTYVINRITLVGALFLGAIAVLPIIMQSITETANLALGGTALLIVVSVAIEFIKRIEAQLTIREYE